MDATVSESFANAIRALLVLIGDEDMSPDRRSELALKLADLQFKRALLADLSGLKVAVECAGTSLDYIHNAIRSMG